MPFEFEKTPIEGLYVIHPRVFRDDRGWFLETFKISDFKNAGITEDFVQDNHSFSSRGVLRGIHFQKAPFSQGKLVRTIDGCVWDVAVDLRKDSNTFGKAYGVKLDSKNGTMLYIPPSFGHGFLVLSDTVHFLYKCTKEYHPNVDCGIRWNDPDLNIPWPIVDGMKLIISNKDCQQPLLKEINKDDL
ncbi:dTDP-4-dehydrorhamnose 3,5-epimerase [Spirochaeta cellobiosiphila]|uniref:dTDP-4-dehydrorhamnose 3,5-epimerase n=1 Tax=Spirochaeta cellobiosiphila TaxID=504483 RepID=UPI000424061D|nr:dTDP-4-dehydrorhamnose 3,5-epimerase [Spirochaeta cellobiosiphila]